MGQADQLIKRIFREETAAATGQRVLFEVPAEVVKGAPRVVAPADVAGLLPPWCHLRSEAVAATGRPAFARAELRRWALWVAQLEETEQPGLLEFDADLDPRNLATSSRSSAGQVTLYRFQSSSDMPLVSVSGPSMRSPAGASLSRAARSPARAESASHHAPRLLPVSGDPSLTSDTSRLDRMLRRT